MNSITSTHAPTEPQKAQGSEELNAIPLAFEAWPVNRGLEVMDWIGAHQISGGGRYVFHSDLTEAEPARLKHTGGNQGIRMLPSATRSVRVAW